MGIEIARCIHIRRPTTEYLCRYNVLSDEQAEQKTLKRSVEHEKPMGRGKNSCTLQQTKIFVVYIAQLTFPKDPKIVIIVIV